MPALVGFLNIVQRLPIAGSGVNSALSLAGRVCSFPNNASIAAELEVGVVCWSPELRFR